MGGCPKAIVELIPTADRSNRLLCSGGILQRKIADKTWLFPYSFPVRHGGWRFSHRARHIVMTKHLNIALILGCLLFTGCRSVYYSAWEKLGKHKRDLLQSKVEQVRDDQQEASEQLKDALTRLQELYGFQGGELEKTYRQLEKDYENSVEKAEAVRKRIREMNTIAEDLFAEWESEASLISSPNLRESSRAQLRETRDRYAELYTATTRAERAMEPVLVKFRDYVLFLKHNLNAQAIGSLQGEAAQIQIDISKLIQEMNTSIRKADEFIKRGK